MSIDLGSERIISFAKAVGELPARRAGKKPHISCMYRWSTRGCRGVVLESIQIGGTRCTSLEAMQRFFNELSAPGQFGLVSVANRRSSNVIRAGRVLDQDGIA